MSGHSNRGGHPETSRIVGGIVVLGIGLAFLLDRMRLADIGDLFQFWPLIFVAIGVSNLLNRQVWGSLWVAVGLLLLGNTLDIISFGLRDLWGLWPILLVFAGIGLVRQALEHTAKDAPSDPHSVFRMFALMGANVRKQGASDLLGGDLVAVMGGCEIDLREAVLNQGEAVIDVLAFWGGIEIRVPRDWNIDVRIIPILGGVENQTEPATNSAGTLRVRGMAIMGGVDIKY